MMNMQNMMRQAQKLQKQMETAKAEIDATVFTGKSPQDLVTVTFTGDKTMTAVNFNADVVDPEDVETLADMTIAAVNDAIKQIETTTEQKMGKFTKGLPF
jgi:DNA-binding YbaB/EbfC family protein